MKLFQSIMLFSCLITVNGTLEACSDPNYPNSCWGFSCCRSDLVCCGWQKCCDPTTKKVIKNGHIKSDENVPNTTH